MYHVIIQVVDDSQPVIGGDDPRYVYTLEVGHSYKKIDIAKRLALRGAELINVNKPNITGKGSSS